MSRGGIFTIITNDGIQDEMYLQNKLLDERLEEIAKRRMSVLQSKKENMGKTVQQISSENFEFLPTFAEIEQTHIVFVNATYKPYVSIAHEYVKAQVSGKAALGSTGAKFNLPFIGDFLNDCVVHIKLTGFAANNAANRVRYVEMLGHRLMKNVSFVHNSQEMDSYTSDRYNINYQFKVSHGKENGYLNCIGQEIPKKGYLTNSPTTDEVREIRQVTNGPQTFKRVQPDIDLYIPLLFWFKDIHSALPIFLFPQGQTSINIEFEDEKNLTAFSDFANVGTNIYTPPKITTCELYMNNIFIHKKLHMIFVKRFGLQLIRVTRTHKINMLTQPSGTIRLNDIKWPVECMYIAFRPLVNELNSTTWHRNMNLIPQTIRVPVVSPTDAFVMNNITYYDETDVISSLGLRLHDTVLYPASPPQFYNAYIPTQYGKNLRTPRDLGWCMMNFNFYPGEYQPSGSINVSRGREFDLDYVSAQYNGVDVIRPENPVEVIVIADCINFLLLSKNTMTRKFIT